MARNGSCTASCQIVTTRDALLTDYFGDRRHRRGLRERRPAHAVRLPRLSARRCEDHRRVGRLPVPGPGLRPLRQEPPQRLVDRRRRFPLRALQGRAVREPRQHGVLRRRAGPRLLGNPVQHVAGARVPGAARDRDEPRHRLHPGAGRRAALPRAHGLQPVQHGLHGRDRGHAGRRHVQVLRLHPGPGDDLDGGQQPAARRLSRAAVRVDGRAGLLFRSRAAVAPEADHGGGGPGADRFHRARGLRPDARQHGAGGRRRHCSTCSPSAATSTDPSSARS